MTKSEILVLDDKETEYGWRTFKGVETREGIFN
jgi:hypothetical protein